MMSCLPLFSFGSSFSSVLRPFDPPVASKLDQVEQLTPASTPKPDDGNDSPYEMLSPVSVSHRRITSFEWVTQSAPNTPPTLGASSQASFSPPPARMIGSAPLPAPDEMWSRLPRSHEERGSRTYFDWLSSPSLGNDKGYTRVSTDEGSDKKDAQASEEGTKRPPLRPTKTLAIQQELNALGISFPSTPPPSPPPSTASTPQLSFVSPPSAARTATPRLPKRVSFSPVIDEVVLESPTEAESSKYETPSWGSYLPSSFLVARPSLPRTTSMPAIRERQVIRPILRHSASSDSHSASRLSLDFTTVNSTEMTQVPQKENPDSPSQSIGEPSSMPTQRIATSESQAHGRRHTEEDPEAVDRAFVELLEATQKPARQRCDSMLSTASPKIRDVYLRPSNDGLR